MISAQFGILTRWQYSHNTTNTSQCRPLGVFAVHIIKPDDTEEINYIHKDHLGSWNTITDESGSRIQELSFDAWGNRRDPATWHAFADTPPEPLFDRGFTGHEHLYAFNLINMNGRVYDPIVSRMLSPDNFIQAPGFSQSLNRYSYCWNNPLKYTDPTGNELGVENNRRFFWWAHRGDSYSSHGIGPGSGNHWSDQYRGEHGDFWLMNQRSFDNKYGDGAYLKGIELNKSSNIFNSLWKSGNIGVNSKVFLVKTTWLNYSGTTGNLNFDGLDYTYGVEIDNSEASNGGGPGWEPYAGTAGAVAGEMFYSKTYGTWMGKNFKMYQQTWGGNGFTGGKLKFGKKVSTGFKIGGYVLGIWNAYSVNSQHSSGQITDGQMYMEQGSNVLTTVGGLYGAAWGVGWELGRAITNTGWYQEAKFNFWYNRWESQVGSPSQSNEALWYYFYQNYKP
jgi:RHS repeat-associated protein